MTHRNKYQVRREFFALLMIAQMIDAIRLARFSLTLDPSKRVPGDTGLRP
jgi:hypothetical protein